jgi:hypothetical protein
LEENIGGASVALSAAELQEITRVSSAIQFEGKRYPDNLMKLVGR